MKSATWVWKTVVGAAAGLLTSVALAGGTSIISQGNRISTLEAQRADDRAQLDRIEAVVNEIERLLRSRR